LGLKFNIIAFEQKNTILMIKEKDDTIMLPDESIMSKIWFVRNEKVMLDRDLAELYEVDTKVLKQAVRRNLDIFS
jgi:hypothetical protein